MRTSIKIGSVTVEVELARGAEELIRGLSGRISLPENQGMLFILDKVSYPVFWMNDMQFPLDVVWIGAKYRVVDISKNLEPTVYPQGAQSKEPVQYVLEVNSGFVDESGIQVGDIAHFSRKISFLKFLSGLAS